MKFGDLEDGSSNEGQSSGKLRSLVSSLHMSDFWCLEGPSHTSFITTKEGFDNVKLLHTL